MRAPLPTDRRARRTREAILDGFAALVTERRYDAVRIADIVAIGIVHRLETIEVE